MRTYTKLKLIYKIQAWLARHHQNRPKFWRIKIVKILNDKDMFEKLKSRKFVALIVTTLITTLGQQVGLSEETVAWLVGVAGSYIVGQGIADFGAQGSQILGKLKSRKLWAYILTTLFMTAGDFLGVSPDVTEWLATIVGLYLVGQGVADAGSQGRFQQL